MPRGARVPHKGALASRLRQLARRGEAADLGAAELEELIDAVGEAVRGYRRLARWLQRAR